MSGRAAVNGARVVWAVVRDGTLEERIREALEMLLGSSGGRLVSG
jgi:hypothetical protein